MTAGAGSMSAADRRVWRLRPWCAENQLDFGMRLFGRYGLHALFDVGANFLQSDFQIIGCLKVQPKLR